jgi:hypothetical protein
MLFLAVKMQGFEKESRCVIHGDKSYYIKDDDSSKVGAHLTTRIYSSIIYWLVLTTS